VPVGRIANASVNQVRRADCDVTTAMHTRRQLLLFAAKVTRNSFLIALEILADINVGVFPYAALILDDELEIWRKHPAQRF
jgi:hypothetical protein